MTLRGSGWPSRVQELLSDVASFALCTVSTIQRLGTAKKIQIRLRTMCMDVLLKGKLTQKFVDLIALQVSNEMPFDIG